MLKTDRLLLRQWTTEDFPFFADICQDKEVMEHFPRTLTQKESEQMGKKISSLINERGWGFWAIEIPNQQRFIGFVGLHIPTTNMPFSPCVEIGWRLSKQHWGKGYATEAARAALSFAFDRLALDRVVSFTTVNNHRSQAVMKKIGMYDSKQNFMHPDLDISHPLCEHVLFKINKADWQQYNVS